IFLLGSGQSTVLGNYVGTNTSGSAAIANGLDGIAVDGGGDNTIGGAAAGAGNLSSGNRNQGIALFGVAYASTSGNLVQGNLVGSAAGDDGTIPNGGDGVRVFSGSDNVIGGIAPGAGNTIRGNGRAGVAVYGATSTGNRINGNSIDGNGGL